MWVGRQRGDGLGNSCLGIRSSTQAPSILNGARLVENGDARLKVVRLQLLVNAMNFEGGMSNKTHDLLLGDIGASKAGNHGYAGAMKRNVTKAILMKEPMPVASALGRHVEGCLASLGLERLKNGPESRYKTRSVPVPAFNCEGDLVVSEVNVFQRHAGFTETAPLMHRNFEAGPHPFRLCLEQLPNRGFFVGADLLLLAGIVGGNAQLRARIRHRKFPRYGFEHDETPDANIQEGGIEADGTQPGILRRFLPPCQIAHDVLPLDLARPPNVERFKVGADRIPALPVLREGVEPVAVAGVEEAEDPMIEKLGARNASRVRFLLSLPGFQLAGLRRFTPDADAVARGFVAGLSCAIAELDPPVRRALTLIEGSHKSVSLSVTSVTISVNHYPSKAKPIQFNLLLVDYRGFESLPHRFSPSLYS